MAAAPAASTVREIALENGFQIVRFGPAHPGVYGDRFLDWLAAGRAGEMDYLHRNQRQIADPSNWLPGVRSAVALGYDYGRQGVELDGGGRVARYATGRDYHRSLGGATRRIRRDLERAGAPVGSIRVGTDSVPILERALAARAGVGFLARSAGVISPTHGPYLFLSELLTSFELPFDNVSPGSCGTCTRCIDACPTGAIVAPFEVDARRCLSYTTIELRGSIPEELREPQGTWLFGCDVCLEVCPFTRFGGSARTDAELPSDLRTHPVLETWSLVGILELDVARYEDQWIGTAMRRATRQGLRRNAAVVLGNLGDANAIPALRRALADPDPVIREHAAWAIGRIEPREPALDSALAGETEPQVQRAIRAAIDRR